VNLVLTGVIAGGIALLSRPAALLFVPLALSSIWLRGYLVPGTPTLTKRYLPARVLSWFGKDVGEPIEGDAFDVAAYLETAGIIDVEGADVSITPEFEVELGDVVFELGDDRTIRRETAAFLGVEPEDIAFERGDPWSVRVEDSIVGRWESRAAFITDLGADRILTERRPDWRGLPASARGRTLSAIRACLDFCPVCAGEVRLGTKIVETCCREEEHVTATCVECDAPLFETRARAIGLTE
jgi:hypothetical protein